MINNWIKLNIIDYLFYSNVIEKKHKKSDSEKLNELQKTTRSGKSYVKD